MLNENPIQAQKQPGIMRRYIERFLKKTHHHYLFRLPSRSGLVPWLLERFFSGIHMDDQYLKRLHQLPENGIYIYTTKFKTYFDYLFYHTRYRKEKVRIPEHAFGFRFWLLQPISRLFRCIVAYMDSLLIQRRKRDPFNNGYWPEVLEQQGAALLPLVEKHDFYRRFVKAKTDPLLFLIDFQLANDRPVYLIPHLMFFSKSPAPAIPRLRDVFFGTERHPGLIRRLFTLFRHPGKVFVEIGEPLDLRQFIQSDEAQERSPEYQALLLRRKLLLQHNRHRQSITGPVIKSHEEIKESILTNERLREFMASFAESRKEPLREIRKQADGFLDEIAAKYNFTFINLISGPIGWLLNTMFDGTVIDKEEVQKLKTLSQKGPLILVPCHKSHIDYLILSWVLFMHNMPCPHIAAGKNLSFWPLGPIFRAGGAFFIRRTFRGAVLYAKVFSEYIYKLLQDGFNIEIFIEGGRSRSGKLLMPKLGFLSILLNAFKSGACEDMIFVPVFIGYDQVLEENAYLHEIEGGKKEPENLLQVIKARRFLKRRYGKIYINFHNAISLQELLQQYDMPLPEMPTKIQNELCRNLGWRIISAIDQASVVTPHALVAAAILNCPARRFTIEDIREIVDSYLRLLDPKQAKFADTILMDHQGACEQALSNYVQRKMIDLSSGEKNMPPEMAQYSLTPAKRLQLEYYKNNCIAYFVPAAFTATAILEIDAFQFSASMLHERYRFLQDFFKYEFAFDVDKPVEHFVRKTLKAFIDDAILMPHATIPDTYQVTSAGLRKLKLVARFLKTYFESYWVVLHYFKQTPRNAKNPKERMKKILSIGKTMLKNEEIELVESTSKINYDNGISFFTTHRVKGSEDDEQLAFYEKTIRHYLGCI